MNKGDTYEGRICKTCGSTLRYLMSKKCVPCKKVRSVKWYEKRSEDPAWVKKENERKAAWTKANWRRARDAVDRWERNNREHVNEMARDRRMKDPDKFRKKATDWLHANPDKRLNYILKSKYGITLKQYNSMVDIQGGLCAICLQAPSDGKRLAVDHCHTTGKVRGLLCIPCNTAIGWLKDDPEIVQRAVEYLSDNTVNSVD